MIDYVCPVDGKKMFEAEAPVGVRVRIFCKRCKDNGRAPVVEPKPVTGPAFLRTCVCETCKRRQTVTTPVDEPGFCMVCGTRTLRIVEEIRPPVETPTEQSGNRPTTPVVLR